MDNVYQTMSDIMNSKKEIMYVYIYKLSDKKVLYLGPSIAGKNADFSQAARLLTREHITGSAIKTNFRRDPVVTDKRSLNIYQPILDVNEINKPVGVLCVSISEDAVSKIYLSKQDQLPLNTFIIDGSGKIVSDSDKEKIGHSAGLNGNLNKKDGSTIVHDKLAVFRYMSGWNWYVVGTLPESYLFRDSDSLLFVTVLIVLIVLAMATLASLRFSRLLLRPLEELISRMSLVSTGDMTTRIDLSHYGGNFRQVSEGFNIMVEQIESLMNKIYEEQRQLKEIEFKALQAQINPHFLYNTLDTIHWQALVNGQEDISTMVKALAGFYRICLSHGHDVIPLKSELSHVKNYLIIQSFRYKDKLESFIDVPEELENLQILKMTLQPLVENSILHGMKGKPSKCFIKITGELSGNDILIRVIDNGVGMQDRQIDKLNQSLTQDGESIGYINASGCEPDGRLESLISTLQVNDFESCCVFIEIFIAKPLMSDKKHMHEIIRAAADYINEHFTEDLTVFTLAKQFHVARSYFSRLFKKEMGEGCNDYITRKRIERAKQLLCTNLKTYEIAEQVGYHDTNYFSLAFKKNAGVSPTEFKCKLNRE